MKVESPPINPSDIYVTKHDIDGVRYLTLGTEMLHGAIRLSNPYRIEFDYVRRMMVWMLWRESASMAQGHAVQLGLGAAAITNYCHHVLGMRTTAVEINPQVVGACHLWFNLPEAAERLNVILGDAAAWVADPANAASVQVLNVDVYDPAAAAPALDDEAFYGACRDVLVDGGIMTVNLFGRDLRFKRSMQRIAAVFGAGHVWHVAPTPEGNAVAVATRGVGLPSRDVLRERALRIETEYGMEARQWLQLLNPWEGGVSRKPKRSE